MKKFLVIVLVVFVVSLSAANVRWKDKADIGTLAATDRMPVTDDIGVSNIDKYFTPAEMAVFTWLTGGTLGAKLTGGASEIEGSNFDINGGAGDAMTLGTNSPITELQVDNLNFNGNTISSTGGTDLNITPLAGQQIVLDGTIIIDAGVVTAATSITTATIIAPIADLGAVTIEKTLSFDGSPEDRTGAGEINSTKSVCQITTGAGAAALTIANGSTEGQIKFLYMVADGGGDATLDEAGWSLVFDDVNEGATLIWDNLNSFWRCIGAAGAVFTP